MADLHGKHVVFAGKKWDLTYGKNIVPPRFLATIVNLQTIHGFRVIWKILATIANVATNQDTTSSGFQKNRSFDVTEDWFWNLAANNKAESWTIQPTYTMLIHVVHSSKRINLMPSLGYQIVYPRAWDDPQELFMFLRWSKQAVSQK